MSKRCTKCGNFLMDDERFCSRCGENVGDVPFQKETVNLGKPEYTQGSQAAQSDNTQGRITAATSHNYNYGAPVPVPAAEEMTFGKWFVTVLVTNMFGIISLIFLFVWGFGSGPKNRQNYCKAMLIVKAISIVIGIIIGIFYISLFGVILNEIIPNWKDIDWSNANFYDYFVKAISII